MREREELAEGIFAQQGKDISNYDVAQRTSYMKGVETRIRSQWELFVENWLNPIHNPLLSIEKVKADNQDCLFMTQQKAQYPDNIKGILQQVLSSSGYSLSRSWKCLNSEEPSNDCTSRYCPIQKAP